MKSSDLYAISLSVLTKSISSNMKLGTPGSRSNQKHNTRQINAFHGLIRPSRSVFGLVNVLSEIETDEVMRQVGDYPTHA
jgi:hypothetical protein